MCCAHLNANTRGAVRDDRIEKANHVNTFLEHAGRELLRLRRVADHDRDNWMNARLDGEPGFRYRVAEIFRVRFEFVAQLGRLGENLERPQTRGYDGRRNGVGKQIRPRALPQKIDNLFATAGKTAARAAKRLAERA